MRDARCVGSHPLAIIRYRRRQGPSHNRFVRRLDRLDAWKVAQELAHRAYLLTLDPKLAKHFALIDQIRRASLSIPANIAEGYSLGTTPQFVRGLKIALGSNTELYSHLTILEKLDLVPRSEVSAILGPCSRSIALIIGLIRKLSTRLHTTAPPPARSLSRQSVS